MRPRILLIGKNGQIGSELAPLLSRLGSLSALDRSDLDLAKPADIRRAISDLRPNLIINAAAYTAVDRAESEESLARAVNAEAPAVIAEEAKTVGALLVHYSTDYVFDGSKRSPYAEVDPANPINAYGRTKLAGEEAIRGTGVPHLIFRTAWVYATSGKNFLLTILRLAAERDELRIVNDQFGAPTWSREIAAATVRVLGGLNVSSLAQLSGTYHMTAAGQATWQEFAVAILDESSRAPRDTPWLAAATGGRPLLARNVIPIATADYPTPAHRPAYSVLSNARFAAAFGFALPDWRAQLASAFRA